MFFSTPLLEHKDGSIVGAERATRWGEPRGVVSDAAKEVELAWQCNAITIQPLSAGGAGSDADNVDPVPAAERRQ